MRERPKPKRLEDLSAIRAKLETAQQQMQASGEKKEPLDAKGAENVAYALRDFAGAHTKFGSAQEAAAAIGKQLTEAEREAFMADLTAAGLLETGSPASDPEHMTEEELLKGLEGLSAPEPSEAQGESNDAVPPHFETAYKLLIDKYRKIGTRGEDQIPLASKGLISNSEYPAFKAFVEARDAEAEQVKKTAKDERKKANGGGNQQVAPETRPAAPASTEVEKKIPYKELVPLGNTEKKLREALGEPAGSVEGIPFWVLEDGDGVMLSPGGDEGAKSPQRIGQEGIRRIKNAVYQYRDGAFHKTTDAEAAKKLRQVRASGERKERTPGATKESQGSSKSEASDSVAESEDGTEKPRTLDEAKRVFFRSHNKEKKKTGVAFRDAVKGLSDKNRKLLIDFVTDTTDTPRAILERIHADVEHEHKQKEELNEEKTRERIRTMMRGETKPVETADTAAESDGEIRSRIRDMIRKNSEA